ncbi:hypothetical protein GW915_14185 [bacterium]|nr:hypothetical protein [bacterium]
MVELSKEEFLKILDETMEKKFKAFKEQEEPTVPQCAENEVWDAEQKKCVTKPAEPAVLEVKDLFGCIVGEEVFSEEKKECVKLTESEKRMLAPILKILKVQYAEAIQKISEAEWDTEYINNLPDSAFATIGAGGEKDADGKTVPRSLRHLPFKNAQGNIDLPHLRNALARLNQIESGSQAEAKKTLCAAAKEVDLASEACGLTEEGFLVEARRKIVDLKAKVADAEKQLSTAKTETLTLAGTIQALIPPSEGLRYFNPAAVRFVESVKRTLLSFKESK